MAVIINDLEVVLEPEAAKADGSGQTPPAEKPQLNPQDLLAILDREKRNKLRVFAH
jgi:hypothetical protein